MQTIQLCDRNICTGCSSCFNACPRKAIHMEPDIEGFLNPIIDNDICVSCGLCIKSCPIITPRTIIRKEPVYYAAINKNKNDHIKSASGGMFSAFARYFYDDLKGYVVAASFDDHLVLHHKISNNKGDLEKFRGSKYVQSEIGTTYKDVKNLLQSGKHVFFIGTPCQVAGLNSYLIKTYDNLFTIDLVCHGVPSPRLFKYYLDAIGVNTTKKFRDYIFRNRKDSAYFNSTVIPKYGFSKAIDYNKHSYICAYLKSWLHRESCYKCPFSSIPRQGDCSISDFWGILAGKVPFRYDKSHGVSMVMVNSQKGEQIFEKVKAYLLYEKKTFEEALIDNHNLIEHDVRPEIRNKSYTEMASTTPEEYLKKYNLSLPRKKTIFQRLIRKLSRLFNIKK